MMMMMMMDRQTDMLRQHSPRYA